MLLNTKSIKPVPAVEVRARHEINANAEVERDEWRVRCGDESNINDRAERHISSQTSLVANSSLQRFSFTMTIRYLTITCAVLLVLSAALVSSFNSEAREYPNAKCIEGPDSPDTKCPIFRCRTERLNVICAKGPQGCQTFANSCLYNSTACAKPGKWLWEIRSESMLMKFVF